MEVWREIRAVFLKELRTEWRTRVAAASTGLFALGGVTLTAMALHGRYPVFLEQGARAAVAASLLWILLYFTAAAGLGRAFTLEEERGTALALRLTTRAAAVWTGKFLANALLLLILAAMATPLLLFALDIWRTPVNVALLSCVVVLGSVGMAATMTFAAALVAQASAKGGMLAAISLPILAPLFVAAVDGSKAAMGGAFGAATGQTPLFITGAEAVQTLIAYAIVSVTAALMIFDYVWNDG